MAMLLHLVLVVVGWLVLGSGGSTDKDIKNYAALENPFRMQKINLGDGQDMGQLNSSKQ